MHDKQAIEMMERCIHEIEDLRRQVERLEPKAHAYDSVATVLRLLPQPPQGYGEDLVWRLRKAIGELQPKVPVEEAASDQGSGDA